MKTLACLVIFFTCFINLSYAQGDTLSGNTAKELLRNLNIDTTSFLRSASEGACKCIDSVHKAETDPAKKLKGVTGCIDDQVSGYEISLKLYRSMTSAADGNYNIMLSSKGSEEYDRHYYELERQLIDSCPVLKTVISSNDVAREKSYSIIPEAIAAYDAGVDFLKSENYAAAIPFFEKAVKADHEFAFAWDNLGVCYRKEGKLEKAEKAYKASLKIDPGGKTPLQNLPVVYLLQKKNEEAIAAYKKILEHYPGDPEVYYGIAVVYFENLKDMEKALDNMCKAYNIYIEQKSPYRSDAEKVISSIFSIMKKDGKESSFNKILSDNKITPF